MAKIEREYLHLSSGVDYIEYQYLDTDGNPVDREAATKCIILECDKAGNILKRMDGRITKTTTAKIKCSVKDRLKAIKDVVFSWHKKK